MEKPPLLKVENLTVSFLNNSEENEVLHKISFELGQNEILGIVGESGSGKSVSVLTIMGLLDQRTARTNSGTVLFNGINLLELDQDSLSDIRGKEISMIFQEPMSSLNPSMKCGEQVMEILLRHTKMTKTDAKDEVIRLFEQVRLPEPYNTYNKYPHQISGGQKQRVMIAMAIACKPKILIADEPTTALDVTVQKEIISLLKILQQENGMSIIFITHDLALISDIADRVIVMYQGDIVEKGHAKDIFLDPKETYTKALIASRPSLSKRLKRLPTVDDFLKGEMPKAIITSVERKQKHKKLYENPPLLKVVDLEKIYTTKLGFFKGVKDFKAVDKVSFEVYEGETLGLVGESGCGKTTLGKTILRLEQASGGSIFYRGKEISLLTEKEFKKLRQEIQIIFQDPYSSLNPRLTVGEAIMEPMKVHKIFSNSEQRKDKTMEILNQVGLSEEHFSRYPHEFSGGQRQRIGIARTIAVQPKLVICDESVSALDISVQAQVLNLLNRLKESYQFTYIFISHDLSVVKYMADTLMVMNKGKIEEMGEADKIYESPESSYTQKLIDAIPKGL